MQAASSKVMLAVRATPLRTPWHVSRQHGAATSSALDFTELLLAAALHIHVMRNAFFGVIVTA
jgi:hypothetical protein